MQFLRFRGKGTPTGSAADVGSPSGEAVVQNVVQLIKGEACPMSGGWTEETPKASWTELPEDLIIRVLSWLPDHDLLCSAAQVCRSWRECACGSALWGEYVNPSALGLPTKRHSTLYMAVHSRNFIRNPCFLEARNKEPSTAWVLNTQGNHSAVAWEFPPAGVSKYEGMECENPPAPLPYPKKFCTAAPSTSDGWIGTACRLLQPALQVATGVGMASLEAMNEARMAEREMVSGCIATSYHWSQVVQEIDLLNELQCRGLKDEEAQTLLDSNPTLGFSILVGGREDCEGKFNIVLQLFDGGSHPSVCRVLTEESTGVLRTRTPGEWTRISILADVPPGTRHVMVKLLGKDSLFWSGFYGTKFASAELRFVTEQDKGAYIATSAMSPEWHERRAPGGL